MEISNQIQVEQQIRQLNDEWVKALVRGDGETLNRIMADDFILTYPLEGDDKADFIGGVTSGDLKTSKCACFWPHSYSDGARCGDVALSRARDFRALQSNHDLHSSRWTLAVMRHAGVSDSNSVKLTAYIINDVFACTTSSAPDSKARRKGRRLCVVLTSVPERDHAR